MPPHKVAGGESPEGVAVMAGLYGHRVLKSFFLGARKN